MSVTFTKLFSSITESTVWCEPSDTRIVWIGMLAMADKHGRVFGSIPGLANRCRVPVEAARVAIQAFLSPDPDSRTKTDEGRRIAEIDGGWVLLNYAKYRSIRDEEERRAYKAEHERKRRAKKAKVRGQNTPQSSPPSHGQNRGQNGQTWTGVDSNGHNADAEADAEALKTHTTASSPRGVAEPPVVEPPPSGVRVMPMHWTLTPEQQALVSAVLIASPPGIVAGLSEGAITPAHRVLVITAVKREAQEHHVSHGEALDGLLSAVRSQAMSIPLDRLNLLGGMEKYFNSAKYRTDPIHVQERSNGKAKSERLMDNARKAASELAERFGGTDEDGIAAAGQRFGGNAKALHG